MKLLGPAEIRDLADQLGLVPTKKLGQNFVIDPNTVRRIVREAGVDAGDRVLEVGPGLGSLTLALLDVGASVVAVEIDHRLAEQLPRTVRTVAPAAAERLTVVREDALRLSAPPVEAATLVANLPYNVAVPVVLHLLGLVDTLERGLVMVQAEVGQRLAAPPGSRIYGAPSVKAAWYGTWSLAGTVSRHVFWPTPNVDSVLVAFRRHPHPLADSSSRATTFAVVDAAFGQRRKTLRQSLAGVFGDPSAAATALESVQIDPIDRPERLSVSDFARIAAAAS